MYLCPTFYAFRSALFVNLQNKKGPCDYSSREFCYDGNVILLGVFDNTIDLGGSMFVLFGISVAMTLLSYYYLDKRVRGSRMQFVAEEVTSKAQVRYSRVSLQLRPENDSHGGEKPERSATMFEGNDQQQVWQTVVGEQISLV
jgi:hypothetical protein